jgi:hypothetical protein
MEARVGCDTGLLPEHLQAVRLAALADGRWQASCSDGSGQVRSLQFEHEGAEARLSDLLVQELGFTDYGAQETTRRLFEPFDIDADWPS